MARKIGSVTPSTSVKKPPGGATQSRPTLGGTIVQSGTTVPIDPGHLRELSTSDGHVRSYSVNSGGLTLILRSEIGRTFTLANSAAHYGSVLSMIIAAAAKDEMVVVSWQQLSFANDTPIAAIGLGTEPLVA